MRDRDWLKENWRWFLPTLGGALLIVIVSSVVIGFIYVAGVVKTSPIYQQSLKKARGNPAVMQKLGKPVKGGLFIDGRISVSHLSGEADFTVPISGPQAEGTLRVQAQKIDGEWVYSLLEVYVSGSSDVINLIPLPRH